MLQSLQSLTLHIAGEGASAHSGSQRVLRVGTRCAHGHTPPHAHALPCAVCWWLRRRRPPRGLPAVSAVAAACGSDRADAPARHEQAAMHPTRYGVELRGGTAGRIVLPPDRAVQFSFSHTNSRCVCCPLGQVWRCIACGGCTSSRSTCGCNKRTRKRMGTRKWQQQACW